LKIVLAMTCQPINNAICLRI